MQPYNGSVSSTYVEFFGSIVSKFPSDDYVFLRSDSNVYTLFIGSLDLDGTLFSGDAECYQLSFDSSYQSNYYNLTHFSSDCSVDASSGVVYSNLGYFPTLSERGSSYDFATLVLSMCCCFVLIFNFIFNFIRR